MYTLQSLPLIRVWLDADQQASTARMLMDGYKLPAIGIVDANRKLIGWVTAVELVGASSDTLVGEIMVSTPTPVDLHISVRDAASELIKRDVDFLPVVVDDQFASVVTSRSLLSKLRESFDPLTELPWSDALREWGIKQLEKGAEIVILFVDLNHFGKFNKQYGHVVGDRVIQTVAAHLRSKIDQKSDILVRYGGDEFAIGTFRDRDEAEELMSAIQGRGLGVTVEGVEVPVTFTIGIYGGRRSKTRNNIHGASNLDNLVNLASRDCLAKKETSPTMAPEQKPAETKPVISQAVVSVPSTETMSKPVIETIQADDEPNSLTYVVIRSGEKLFVGVSPKMGHSKSDSIAIATGKALEKAFPEVKVIVDSVTVERAGSTELVTTRVRTIKDNLERDITAQAEANGDLDDTIGLAVISTVLAE
jgi:IMP dehydrogenase